MQLDLLQAYGFVCRENNIVSLNSEFRSVLKYRDYIESTIEFANVIAPDVSDRLSLLFEDEAKFMESSRLFELFGYHRCFEITDENIRLTKRWVNFTTGLTRYEAKVCLHHHDFCQYKTMMDIGGNSGEFALQACKKHPELQVIVVDLPVVCEIGLEHVAQDPEASRIQFKKANALLDELPKGLDLVTFKSILHDWPKEGVDAFLEQAHRSLRPGGTVLIFERGPIDSRQAIPYSMLPIFMFFRSFRSPELYCQQLESAGFEDVTIKSLALKTGFSIISAQKCR